MMAAESNREKIEEDKKDGAVVRFFKWVIEIICKEIILKYIVPLIIAELGGEWLKVNGWREVMQSSPAVTIDRPGPWTDVMVYYGVVSIIGGLLAYFLSRLLKETWTVSRSRRIETVLTFNILLLLAAFFFSPNFLIPNVGPKMDISGHVTNPGDNYYVFVRPTDSQRCWLQAPIPLLPDQNRYWNAVAFFGGRKGQLFELIAIASAGPLHPSPFSAPGSYDCSEIRGVVERSVRLVRMK